MNTALLLVQGVLGFVFVFGLGCLTRCCFRIQSQPVCHANTIFLGLLSAILFGQLVQALQLPVVLLWILPLMSLVGLYLESNHWLRHCRSPIFWVMVLGVLVWMLTQDPGLPMAAWDAWVGWELKAKQWHALGLSANLLIYSDWIQSVDGWFNATADYPDGLSLMFYYGLAVFEDSQWMRIFLFLCYFSVVLSVIKEFADKRSHWGFMVLGALMFLTVPLINNHLMMFAYADLWIGMVLLLSVVQLSRWNEQPSKSSAWVLFGLLVLLPMFKLEGWVWVLLLLFAQFFSKFLIRRHRYYLLGMAALAAFLWFYSDRWSFNWVEGVVISQYRIQIGEWLDWSFVPQNVGFEVFSGLFLQNNFGLLWYFLPCLLAIWLFKKFPKSQEVSQTFFVFSFMAFLLLFFLTDASVWAVNYTAVNRIVLQLTPTFLYLLLMTFMEWGDKKRASSETLSDQGV